MRGGTKALFGAMMPLLLLCWGSMMLRGVGAAPVTARFWNLDTIEEHRRAEKRAEEQPMTIVRFSFLVRARACVWYVDRGLTVRCVLDGEAALYGVSRGL